MVLVFAAGVAGWQPVVLGLDGEVAAQIGPHWPRGLAYMAAVMAVLTAHESGHFIAARLHGIPATLPFFIPVPILLTGTLGAVIGMEALIRWQHPQRGLLAPYAFLPIVENHALSVDIGEWVIASALSQISLWQQQGLQRGPRRRPSRCSKRTSRVQMSTAVLASPVFQ